MLLGLVGYGAGALLSLPKAPPTQPGIDAFAVNEPWRQFVQSALRSQRRFRDGVNATREGPLRDNLTDLGQRVDDAVAEVWRIAQRGNTVAKARRQVDEPSLRRKIEQLRPEPGAADPDDSAAKTVEVARGPAGERRPPGRPARRRRSPSSSCSTPACRRASTRAHELAATADEAADFEVLDADLDSIVTEMESVRAALDETRAAGAGGVAGPAIGAGDDQGAIPPMPASEGTEVPRADQAPRGTDRPADDPERGHPDRSDLGVVTERLSRRGRGPRRPLPEPEPEDWPVTLLRPRTLGPYGRPEPVVIPPLEAWNDPGYEPVSGMVPAVAADGGLGDDSAATPPSRAAAHCSAATWPSPAARPSPGSPACCGRSSSSGSWPGTSATPTSWPTTPRTSSTS